MAEARCVNDTIIYYIGLIIYKHRKKVNVVMEMYQNSRNYFIQMAKKKTSYNQVFSLTDFRFKVANQINHKKQ